MNFNFIETDDIVKTILDLNHVSLDELNKEYDFTVNDEVFLNFKETLLQNKNKKFLIVGDYDADGICATAIISKLLTHLNIKSNFYIPSRIKEGYGLNKQIVENANKYEFDALFLVDNGVVAYDAINLAHQYGIDVFIIDHHEYEVLPNVEAIIHSNIVSDKFKNLSAGGLSFVLSSMFYDDDLSCVLAGISTISDMMPVIGFNRTLIKKMYELLLTKDIYQIKMLNDNKDIDYESLSYNVIPKINAISRMEPMGNPNYVVKFLLEDKLNSLKYIGQINDINTKRKQLTSIMYEKAIRLISDDDLILVYSNDFQEGLCGLIANKIMHTLNKPAIVLSYQDGVYKGSGRAVNGFNMFEKLKSFDLYEAYGGHECAVGLSIKEENFDRFKDYISKFNYNDENVRDAIIINEDMINEGLLNKIESLKPFGTGLLEPLLVLENKNYKKIIIQSKYPKYIINNYISAISFNESHKNEIPSYFIGSLCKDKYRANSLSFTIEEMV